MHHSIRIALIVSVVLLSGCATRTVNHSVINHYGLDIMLRSEKPIFRPAVARGYAQPAVISAPRLEAILRGIEIDTRKSDKSAIRQRRNAIHPELIGPIAEGLSQAFAEANPDQQVVVMALRKHRQKLIFDRKFLTSFVTWIDGGRLYVALSRVDWPWDPKSKNDKLPQPWPEERVMSFKVVASDIYEESSRQTVRLDWRSEAFGPAPLGEEIGSADRAGDDDETAAAGKAGAAAAATGAGAAVSSEGNDPLVGLAADDYRALADLEEARQSGAIDEDEYERRRNEILGGGD